MGGSNEFFDKFSVRYHVSVILKQLWLYPTHHSTMVAESASTQDNACFIRFINMLINDTTFLLDESLDALKAIHETQEAQKDKEAWNNQPRVGVAVDMHVRRVAVHMHVRGVAVHMHVRGVAVHMHVRSVAVDMHVRSVAVDVGCGSGHTHCVSGTRHILWLRVHIET